MNGLSDNNQPHYFAFILLKPTNYLRKFSKACELGAGEKEGGKI